MNIRGYTCNLSTHLEYSNSYMGVLLCATLTWMDAEFSRSALIPDCEPSVPEMIYYELSCALIDKFDRFLEAHGLPYEARP